MSECAIPALERLDDLLGSRTVAAHEHVLSRHPELGAVAITLSTESGNKFHKNELGIPSCSITINPQIETYQERLDSGQAAARFPWLVNFLQADTARPIELNVPELITAIFLHELGHAAHFQRLIVEADSNVKAAYATSQRQRFKQLSTIPLGMASSRALKKWAKNTDGYRDDMQAQGYDEVAFKEILDLNRVAYAQLPCEVVADEFALANLKDMRFADTPRLAPAA